MLSSASVKLPLLEKLRHWASDLRRFSLLAPASETQLLDALSDAAAGRLESPPPPLLTVLLLGASGGGKSELLNALAGSRIAASHHRRPTTTQPAIYAHQSMSPARLFEYGSLLGGLAAAPGVCQTHGREELRNKVIIDAPDIDSYQTEHREIVMRLLPMVDVVLYVVTPTTYKDDIGWSTVLKERGRRAFAFVLNKWDTEAKPAGGMADADVDADFRALLISRAGYEKPVLFRVSARHWAAPESERPAIPPPLPGEQFAELKQWLSLGLSTSRVEQIQRRRRRALWGALAAAISSSIPQTEGAVVSRWLASAKEQLGSLTGDGQNLLLLSLASTAEELAPFYAASQRPDSPGPFGKLMQAFRWIKNSLPALPGNNRLRANMSAAPHPSEPQSSHHLQHDEADWQNCRALVEGRTDAVEWSAREAGIPAGYLAENWPPLLDQIEPRLRERKTAASARIMERKPGQGRRWLGITLLVLLEVVTTGVLGLATWRLGSGFVSGQYADMTFLANLLALLAVILLAGAAALSALFPNPEKRIFSELQSEMKSEWQRIAIELETLANNYAAELDRLRADGIGYLNACDAQISGLTREMSQVEKQEADRLFAPK